MNPLSRLRLWLSVLATGMSRVTTTAYGFVLVPLLLSAWGVEVYGEWVILTAFTAIAALSNFGFVQASASEIAMRIGSGEHDEAANVVRTTIAAVLCLIALILVPLISVLIAYSPNALLGVHVMPAEATKVIIVLVVLKVLLDFLISPLAAAVGSVLGVGVSAGVATALKCIELVAIFVVVMVGGTPLAVAAVMPATVVANILVLGYLIRRHLPWLRLARPVFHLATVRRLLRPSLGIFVLYATVNILAIQVPRIVLGHLVGAAGVALFSVAVTYARAARTLPGILGQSLQVELSKAFGDLNLSRVRGLLKNVYQFSLWIALAAGLLILLIAKPVFLVWTQGHFAPDWLLLSILIGSAIVGAFSDVSLYFLVGINRVWALALTHIAASVVGVSSGTLLFPKFGLAAMAGGLLVPEVLTAVVGIAMTSDLLRLGRIGFFIESIQFPLGPILREGSRLLSAFRRMSFRV